MSNDEYKKTALANLSTKREPVTVDEEPTPQADARSIRRRQIQRASLKPLPTEAVLQLRDAPPPPPGYRYTLDGRLVPTAETTLSIEDPDAQDLFCEVIELTGSLRAACDALGLVSTAKVKRYIDRNPDFAELVEASAQRHRDSLYAHGLQRATVGYLKPIIGGPDKDQIVGYERVVSDSLLALFLKRHFVEFREAGKAPAQNLTVNTGPQVNVTNVKAMSREDRDQLRELLNKNKPSGDPQGIIDVDPDPKQN
jgi:hypothetical protein